MQTRAGGRVVLAALFFVMGLSTVFMLLGAAASAFGRAILQYQGWLVSGSGLLIMLFGLHFLAILRLPFLNREARFGAADQGGSIFGAYLLGLAFAFGWTPCIGPVLASILGLAATEANVARGTLLLGVYALGLGLPFLLVAALFPRLTGTIAAMKRNMSAIERISGLLLWTVGLMMVTGQFTDFSWWLLEAFPALATLG
jgi:cytochrome c-type biogenesis protein